MQTPEGINGSHGMSLFTWIMIVVVIIIMELFSWNLQYFFIRFCRINSDLESWILKEHLENHDRFHSIFGPGDGLMEQFYFMNQRKYGGLFWRIEQFYFEKHVLLIYVIFGKLCKVILLGYELIFKKQRYNICFSFPVIVICFCSHSH